MRIRKENYLINYFDFFIEVYKEIDNKKEMNSIEIFYQKKLTVEYKILLFL